MNFLALTYIIPAVRWDELFAMTTSPIELFLRGTAVYIFILTVMRVLRREPGTVGIADLLMVVLIADASQNAMAGDYHSLLDGLILVLTIVFWNFLMDWLSLRWKAVERFTYPPPIALVQNQKMMLRNMSRQLVTENQLRSIVREHGIDDLAKVKAVYIEGSGHISVIPADDHDLRSEDDHRERRAS
jgi:uncharacterized membrane protein YcaP (DUF421 family)